MDECKHEWGTDIGSGGLMCKKCFIAIENTQVSFE